LLFIFRHNNGKIKPYSVHTGTILLLEAAMTQKERERFYFVSTVNLKATCLSGIGEMRDLNVHLTLSRDGLVFTQPNLKLKNILDIYHIYNIELVTRTAVEDRTKFSIPGMVIAALDDEIDTLGTHLLITKNVTETVHHHYLVITYDEIRQIVFEVEKKHKFQAEYFVNFWNSFLVGEPQVQEDDTVYDRFGFRVVDLGEQRRATTRRRLEKPLLDLQIPEKYKKLIAKKRRSAIIYMCFMGFLMLVLIALTIFNLWYDVTHPKTSQHSQYMDSHVLASSYTGEPDEIDLLLSDFDDIRAETVQEG